MRSLVCLPFSADITAAVLNEIADPSLFVFPTHASASRARRIFQPRWQLEDVDFITMEELRQMLIPAPLPDLQDEKRLLCLWQVLEEEDKQTFHLYCYDDLVSWGQSFLSFFAEMKDELADLSLLGDPTAAGLGTRLWQEEHLRRVLAIRQRYQEFIASLGFTDRIFYLEPASVRIPFSARKVVFANQYYFSDLEKHLVDRLEDHGCEIVFLHQGPQGSFDPLKLESKALDLNGLDPGDYKLRDLRFVEAPDQTNMALGCLAEYGKRLQDNGFDADQARRVLIDPDFAHQAYSRHFNPAAFRFNQAVPMPNTRLYQVLCVFGRHLKALAESDDARFLPLAEIAMAIAVPGFLSYYRADWDERDREKLLDELRLLSSKAVLYIDLELRLFASDRDKDRYSLLYELLRDHFTLLGKLVRIDSLSALCGCFDEAGMLQLARLCAPEELSGTDILDQFWESLANFRGVEELGLVKDWGIIFSAAPAPLASGIWKLWLDHLGGASFGRFTYPASPAYETSNLMDSRNLSWDELIVFNCVEGSLPANPEPVWLLNETQRKKLGLKHYDLVRQWERYYFLRLLLSSSKAELYYYSDPDRDLEPGSYVTELLQWLAQSKQSPIRWQHDHLSLPAGLLSQAQSLVRQDLSLVPYLTSTGLTGYDKAQLDSFFRLPCQPDSDLDSGISSTYYDLKQLGSNPFAWYVNCHRKLRPVNLLPQETITPMLFGSIMHSFLSRVLQPLGGDHSDIRRLKAAFTDLARLESDLQDLLSSDEYQYKLPRNYNREFLFGVISECLVSSVRDFYSGWLEPVLKAQSFRLIPEAAYSTREERIDKILLSFGERDRYRLGIHGKADLRVCLPDRDYIVDFKTGQADAEQLIFYEYFYYRLDPEYKNQLNSLFWMVLDARRDSENITDKKREAWIAKLRAVLEDCLNYGYGIGSKASDREHLKAITRADLWTISAGRQS